MQCIICNKEIDKSRYSNKILCSTECFMIDYWNDRVKDINPKVAIIKGEHYTIGNEKEKGGFRGFGGRKFIINFFDGRIVETTNLWYQGVIPEDFKDSLPDNAQFINW